MANYYQILGITFEASSEEIKKAYRIKAKLYHPDINKSADAAEFFILLKEAYFTLIDENKRYIYDSKLRPQKENNTHSRQRTTYKKTKHSGPYSSFHYDWQSFQKAYAEKKERLEKPKPFIYNLFFGAGIMSGTLVCAISLSSVIVEALPPIALVVVILGYFIMKGGWDGYTGKKSDVWKEVSNYLRRKLK